MTSADMLHSPKVHLALGGARDSFDEETWNYHIGQVQNGQVRAIPDFSAAGNVPMPLLSPSRVKEPMFGRQLGPANGFAALYVTPTTEEIRYASGGYGGRRNVDWNPNNFSEVGMSGLGPQSPQSQPNSAPLSATFGAAGIGSVDDGRFSPTLPHWSARKDTHVRTLWRLSCMCTRMPRP
jgi:hypothetical protein